MAKANDGTAEWEAGQIEMREGQLEMMRDSLNDLIFSLGELGIYFESSVNIKRIGDELYWPLHTLRDVTVIELAAAVKDLKEAEKELERDE